MFKSIQWGTTKYAGLHGTFCRPQTYLPLQHILSPGVKLCMGATKFAANVGTIKLCRGVTWRLLWLEYWCFHLWMVMIFDSTKACTEYQIVCKNCLPETKVLGKKYLFDKGCQGLLYLQFVQEFELNIAVEVLQDFPIVFTWYINELNFGKYPELTLTTNWKRVNIETF